MTPVVGDTWSQPLADPHDTRNLAVARGSLQAPGLVIRSVLFCRNHDPPDRVCTSDEATRDPLGYRHAVAGKPTWIGHAPCQSGNLASASIAILVDVTGVLSPSADRVLGRRLRSLQLSSAHRHHPHRQRRAADTGAGQAGQSGHRSAAFRRPAARTGTAAVVLAHPGSGARRARVPARHRSARWLHRADAGRRSVPSVQRTIPHGLRTRLADRRTPWPHRRGGAIARSDLGTGRDRFLAARGPARRPAYRPGSIDRSSHRRCAIAGSAHASPEPPAGPAAQRRRRGIPARRPSHARQSHRAHDKRPDDRDVEGSRCGRRQPASSAASRRDAAQLSHL